MERKIPGTILIEGRKYIYIQSSSKAEFSSAFNKIGTLEKDVVPKSGGMISENVFIKLPDGIQMFGVSYKGDIEGWERNVLRHCSTFNLIYGRISDETMFLSDSRNILLSLCEINFY